MGTPGRMKGGSNEEGGDALPTGCLTGCWHRAGLGGHLGGGGLVWRLGVVRVRVQPREGVLAPRAGVPPGRNCPRTAGRGHRGSSSSAGR